MILHEDQELLIQWAELNGGFKYRYDAKALGWFKNGKIVAVSVMDTWEEWGCAIHIVSDGSHNWLSRYFLRMVFTWLFVDLDLNRVTGLVPIANESAVRFNQKLGFTKEGLLREADAGGDIVIMGMLKSECRWIPTNRGNSNG